MFRDIEIGPRQIILGVAMLAGLAVLGVVGFLFAALRTVPDYGALREYKPPITTRVHAGDGALVAEFANEHRMFVPISAIPERLQHAFVAAEDQNFYHHSGVDARGVARAMMTNVVNVVTGKRLQGASTITQQVAGNMLTGRERSLYRKIREAFLATRIEQALDKNRILELYLNEIYLGRRAYGVASAALNYFDKSLDELTISEMAFLAALPKAPSNYDPVQRREAAITRRNYVLGRMAEDGYITREEEQAARAEPLTARNRLAGETYIASSQFVEEVRRRALEQFGEKELYEEGFSIRTTLDTRLQLVAVRALRRGLEQYDRRHNYRGPIDQGDANGDVQAQLRNARAAPALTGWHRAMVTATQGSVRFTTEAGATGRLTSEDAQWAASGARGSRERALRAGSIIYVLPGDGGRFALKQTPQVQGALVALDPHTGRVLAMVGGYDFTNAGYNRATQALRQPGSAFKPIVYAAALDFGVTPATLIEDGPLSIEAGDGSMWSPENYTREFYGPTTLRRGLEQSRNAMTARVAYEMGVERVAQYGERLGVFAKPAQAVFALALGSGETSPLRLTTAYAQFVNGGKKVSPVLIDRVQNRDGTTVYHADQRPCEGCRGPFRGRGSAPQLPDTREQVLDPITAYQIVSMSEGVVQRGTATVVASLNRPLGGKTGTTNDYRDAWFVGYSPDLVAGVWVGFDQPRDMGEGETGGRISAPIFRDFMEGALRGEPATPFRIPAGVRLVRIDAMTGLLPGPNTTSTIMEAFKPGTEPTENAVSSPFIFGGTEPIDPRVFRGLSEGIQAADERVAASAQQQQREQGPEEALSGLY
ncbi:MAG: penicillin-binding protein 1A [Hyphomonadaceae bacterium]|nr:penicillin-binding protein 1A [Hyphomonadaceae bacterium]